MVALGSFFKDGDRPVDLVGWLIKDGYIFDYLMSVAALLINTLVPTGKLKTVQRNKDYSIVSKHSIDQVYGPERH